MKIICICKTFSGPEFAISSLDSVYNHIDKMVYVHGKTDWLGREGNEVRAIVEATADPDKKLIHLTSQPKATQQHQYDVAIDFILGKGFEYDYIMLLDTDEVLKRHDWDIIEKELENNLTNKTPHLVYKCRLKTFIKSPFYQIDPDVTLQPVLFIHRAAIAPGVIGIRAGSFASKAIPLKDVYLYHFTSVRNTLDQVWAKHETSCGSENEPIVDKDEWVQTVWNRLPNAINCLPLKRFTHLWPAVKVVQLADLPEDVHKNPLVMAWQRYMTILPHQRSNTLPTSAELMRVGLPSNFGPNHKYYKLSTMRTRYQQLLNRTPEERAAPAVPPKEKSHTVEPPLPQIDLKPSKEVVSQNKGNLCVTTIVSGSYQWYIPLFLYCLKKAIPSAAARIYIRGEVLLPEMWKKVCLELPGEFAEGPYNTASLRFCYSDEALEEFDYCLITDIDIMMQPESISLVDQHMRTLVKNRLLCYDNYVSTNTETGKRVPGVHFVTKDWWRSTATARERYLELLKTEEIKDYSFDETMLYKIISESGLPEPPKLPNLWAHHGIHLGDYRKRIESKKKPKTRLQGDHYMFIQSLLADRTFLGLLKECSIQNPVIGKIFDYFRRMYYL